MAKYYSAFVLATFLLFLMVSHIAHASRPMQVRTSPEAYNHNTNMVYATRTNPTETGLTDNKNLVFGSVGSGIGGGVGVVGPFGGVGGFSGVGGGVGGVGFPFGGAVGGVGGVSGGGVGGIIP